MASDKRDSRGDRGTDMFKLRKKGGHGQVDKECQDGTEKAGDQGVGGGDQGLDPWVIMLLERIAFNTSGTSLTFEDYMAIIKESSKS